MEELLDPNYGPGHRAFVQSLLARGTMSYDEARPVIAAIWTALEAGACGAGADDSREYAAADVTEQYFLDYIDIARQAVSLFDYDIRTTLHQRTKKRVYVLVNTTSDPQTQLATTYSPGELSFIKRLLDAMFETYNTPRMEVMALTQMQAMKLSRPAPSSSRRQSAQQNPQDDDVEGGGGAAAVDRGLKHGEVEDVLASLVDGGWLERSREKFYSLTPRGLLELRPWLVETYNDPDAEADEWQRVKFCVACKDILTYGLRCADPSCVFRLHDTCQDAFWRVHPGGRCPRCKKDWAGTSYVGERAVTQTEAFQRGRRRPRPAAAASPRISHNGDDDDDDDDDDDEDEEGDAVPKTEDED
ncbi:Nse1 non-SMC component of SMC5-6 complex [Geosmithia morbida]|uniref:Non-structural maintenance of chromosomes element 1 homolog n=1 Tax=Geosmithia morbida TaxID=1094350 RepID=A0A9P4YVU6_9HYPO|nr:Nse1 non-SMC component of SMC5-6 complex [Geosmithia morbida]KAF4123780.1 Nse1 non-SMC component of SMC5-6 complex [Geosmithia morbida]